MEQTINGFLNQHPEISTLVGEINERLAKLPTNIDGLSFIYTAPKPIGRTAPYSLSSETGILPIAEFAPAQLVCLVDLCIFDKNRKDGNDKA